MCVCVFVCRRAYACLRVFVYMIYIHIKAPDIFNSI